MKKVWTGALAIGLLVACEPEKPPRRDPPPMQTGAARGGVCTSGAETPRDPMVAAVLPMRSGAYCVDPHGSDKAYGDDAPKPFDRACEELLDGECEVYKSFGALRTVESRYVSDLGDAATITVLVTKFSTAEGAYAMFTQRVVGDGDPASEVTPKPVEAPLPIARGANNVYLVRGPFLAEIVLTDQGAVSVDALRARCERDLVPFAQAAAQKLTGDLAPPPAVAVLPTEKRLPLGVRYHLRDVLGIAGVGPGAVGYYRDGQKRYRVAAALRNDADQAKDLLSILARQPGATREKAPYDGLVRVVVERAGEAPAEWVFWRTRGVVLGVGDEVRVLRDTMTADDRAALLLSTKAKMALLKDFLEKVERR
ncbi:MAG: hypothetical protein IPK82_25670 [Polyangiaceae bacterium]|nr:hypothetical protein [Polyangiaceae bacterium]